MQNTVDARPILPLILIVEDANFNLHAEKLTLEANGYEVVTTTEGASALTLTELHSPAAIVLDLNLPDMNGIDVLKSLKAEEATSDIPVLICSADGNDETVASCKDAGAKEYLIKPFSAELFIDAVERVLDRNDSEPDPETAA